MAFDTSPEGLRPIGICLCHRVVCGKSVGGGGRVGGGNRGCPRYTTTQPHYRTTAQPRYTTTAPRGTAKWCVVCYLLWFNTSLSMLRKRTEIVREVVQSKFNYESELDKRRIESVTLQILATIYAPPRTATPIDINALFECVRQSKSRIDQLDQLNPKSCQASESPESQQCEGRGNSPIPIQLYRDFENNIVTTASEDSECRLIRPIPRRAPR